MSVVCANARIIRSLPSYCRKVHTQTILRKSEALQEPRFGLLFDIDGVLVRGKKPICAARKAFARLTDKHGKFRVPTVFVTNAGNSLAKTKAEQLSDILDVEITSEPVMMSHSPLRMFQSYHDKCVLLSGQGPVEEIAKKIGFTNTVTIEQICKTFPNLDMVDHKQRPNAPSHEIVANFPKIDAIVLFGEPTKWETSLQLLIDVLLTNGKLTDPVCEFPDDKPHLPILACNMDLLWMAESHMPRFGHGTFLHCLESVFEKLVGKPLTYTALMGKPSEITYTYAERLVMRQATEMRLQDPIQRLYAIGDNPMADIYGANLYNRRLKEMQDSTLQRQAVRNAVSSPHLRWEELMPISEKAPLGHVKSCHSILVSTGVYSPQPGGSSYQIPPVFHGPRDMELNMSLCMPDHITQDVNTALNYIEEVENFKFGTPV